MAAAPPHRGPRVSLVMPTRILVVGNGAREHALVWKLANEPGVNAVFANPGSSGTIRMPRVHRRGGNIHTAPDVVQTARRDAVELAVIGPELPLAEGLADALVEAGIPTFGPSAAAARIETSKAFCREIAEAAGVPMADGRAFTADQHDAATRYATELAAGGHGAVVKADGLAGGKGVTVCETAEQARHAIAALDGAIVVEERLDGLEASVIALCDGRDAIALPISRDHKRLLDGDRGPNTGGMGAYSPLPDLPDDAAGDILDRFHRPVLKELARRGTPFRGALYAGLMLTDDGPRLLEFNARFGDPETQVIVPRLGMALGPLLLAAARGSLSAVMASRGISRVPTLPIATVGIVLASEGYPGDPRLGETISGLDDSGNAAADPDALVFHASTFHANGPSFRANGGRVLTVIGRGRDLNSAREAAERAAERISWPGMQRRRDIALRTPAAGALATAGVGR